MLCRRYDSMKVNTALHVPLWITVKVVFIFIKLPLNILRRLLFSTRHGKHGKPRHHQQHTLIGSGSSHDRDSLSVLFVWRSVRNAGKIITARKEAPGQSGQDQGETVKRRVWNMLLTIFQTVVVVGRVLWLNICTVNAKSTMPEAFTSS